MKRKVLFMALICCIAFTGCGNKESRFGNSEAVLAETVQDQAASQTKEQINVKEVCGRLVYERPADWVAYTDGGYYKNGRAQFMMMTFEDYNLKELKKNFGYEDEMSALHHYFMDAHTNAVSGEKYEKQQLVLPGYRFFLEGDKYYPGGLRKSDEKPFLLQVMVDKEKKTLYMLYFFDEMANEERADEFLAKISLFDEKNFYDEAYGLYLWQHGDEIFSEDEGSLPFADSSFRRDWGTGGYEVELFIKKSGAFTGQATGITYDGSAEREYDETRTICAFTGVFDQIKEVKKGKYSLEMGKFEPETKTEYTEMGTAEERARYQFVSTADGFEEGNSFILYCPKYQIKKLPKKVREWIYDAYGIKKTQKKLKDYLLYNKKTGETYRSITVNGE